MQIIIIIVWCIVKFSWSTLNDYQDCNVHAFQHIFKVAIIEFLLSLSLIVLSFAYQLSQVANNCIITKSSMLNTCRVEIGLRQYVHKLELYSIIIIIILPIILTDFSYQLFLKIFLICNNHKFQLSSQPQLSTYSVTNSRYPNIPAVFSILSVFSYYSQNYVVILNPPLIDQWRTIYSQTYLCETCVHGMAMQHLNILIIY